MAVIGRHTIPIIPQYKAQEKGGRHSLISEILRNSEEEVYFSNGIALETLLLKPITSIASYK